MTRSVFCVLAVLVGVLACGDSPGERPPSSGLRGAAVDWSSYAGDAGSQRWSTADDITPVTVKFLEPAWEWATDEGPIEDTASKTILRPGKFEATPLIIRDTLYVVTPFNRVVAIDATNGRQLWSFDPQATARGLFANDHAGFVHRGLSAWNGPDGLRIILASRTELFSLRSDTGKLDSTFGRLGVVDLAADLRWPANRKHVSQTSPPAIFQGAIIVGSAVGDGIIYERDPPGDVQAFDARTGTRLWRWDPVPEDGDSARISWGGGSADITGHVNVWAPISVDTSRGLAYLPLSTPSNDWYGGNRLGDNLYAESIVCLDARSGKLVWYRQLVRHGLWDYDLAAPPALASLESATGTRDVVLVAAKTGFLYGFDRVTGEPLWPLQDRSVPASDVPGEVASTTQPHVDWPKPFSRQGFTEADVTDLSPRLRDSALARIRGLRLGPMFTPPSLAGTVVAPGWIGGAGWGATAIDPGRQMIFVKSSNTPVIAKVVATGDRRRFIIDSTQSPADAGMLALPPYRTWYGARRQSRPVPIGKPPFGQLTAYDLASGDVKWQVTLGDMPDVRQHPWLRGRNHKPLGVSGAPGPVATAGGLLFLTGGGTTLYAIGSDTGETFWSFELGKIGYSNPAVYRTSGGRQFVVVATGGGGGASLQAFALANNSLP